jgi:hypothetical protein
MMVAPISIAVRVAAALILLQGCRASAAERGPLLPGDEELARERIESNIIQDGEPPPPPIDTLASLRLAPSAAVASVVDPNAPAVPTTTVTPTTGIRARYYLREDGKRGWISFPRELQPAGVTVDSAARIIIRDGKIGGAGMIIVRDSRGTLTIDLSQHLRGIGTEISGRCGPPRPGRGSCATLVFDGVPFTPVNGPPSTQRVQLDIGVSP